MTDMSDKWDKQWGTLLTRCHGEEVQANAEFKSNLLDQLKNKTAQNLETGALTDTADDEKWSRLMKAAYVPCHYEEDFKSDLLGKLKTKLGQTVTAVEATTDTTEDKAIRTILTRIYQPVAPRKEFETRLLDNLKERQRVTTVYRKKSSRRALFLSSVSGLAAAAMVMFVVWVGPAAPATQSAIEQTFASAPVTTLPIPNTTEAAEAAAPERRDLRLPLPEMASVATPVNFDDQAFSGGNLPAVASPYAFADVGPASFDVVPASFTNYRVADAFSGPALPENAFALQNIEMDSGDGWVSLSEATGISLAAGMTFRSRGGMGHLRFSDGSLVTVTPNALMKATDEGFTVERGLALVSVPDTSRAGFRLHFTERDIAIEPGTDLAVMVESPDGYAEGGAPAPMVMVVDRQDSPGGLALARGERGVGPLFSKQIYRLDRYVTPALPGRALCETECQDLDKFFKMETVRQIGHPMASFAGGFATNNDRDMGYTATVITPAGYSKRGDKWVSDKYRGEQTIKLSYLSDSYFGFANARRDLARDLALGSQVIIDGGDGKFYEIGK